MSPQLVKLLDHLRKTGVPEFTGLFVDEANHMVHAMHRVDEANLMAHALHHALISLDAAMVNQGQIDWMDDLTRRLRGY